MSTSTTQNANIVQRFDEWLGTETTPRRALLTYAVLFAYFVVLLVPMLYLVLATFLPQKALYSSALIPSLGSLTLEHYVTVLSQGKFQNYFINSTIIAVSTTVLSLTTGVIAAYSLSRFDYPGRDFFVIGYLSTQMLPRVLILIPFFLLMFNLTLINTYIGIILAHTVVALPFTVWLLKGYFDDIPTTLDEAAKMDGCNQFDILGRIILPLSAPGIAVAGFYAFIGSWNDFLFVSLLSQTSVTRTLPYGLQLFQSSHQVNWGLTLTAAVVTMLPVIVLFALLQKWVVEGLASGGMKGA